MKIHHTFLPVILLFSVLCTISGFRSADSGNYAIRWVLLKGGSLQVLGSTNVNKFTCAITGYGNFDTITVYKTTAENQPIPLKGMLSLDVSLFDCRNPIMTGDLRKTLKAKAFPKLKIRFINLNRFPSFAPQNNPIKGVVDIELAGVSRRFDVSYTFSKDEQRTIHLLGERFVNFSDFNLIPPRKLGGMIQTEDRLKVQFELSIKSI